MLQYDMNFVLNNICAQYHNNYDEERNYSKL